jgi:hypothetical protein
MRIITWSISALALVTSLTGNAVADSACTNSDAIRQITQLSYLEQSDAFSTSPSAAGPQRQAIMRELARKYCRSVSQYPSADYQDTIAKTDCTIYSGVIDDQRIYWAKCPTCAEGGACE